MGGAACAVRGSCIDGVKVPATRPASGLHAVSADDTQHLAKALHSLPLADLRLADDNQTPWRATQAGRGRCARLPVPSARGP